MESTNINLSNNFAEDLYTQLNVSSFSSYPYENRDLNDGMSIISQVIFGYWKPRFLMDNNAKTAVEFMDANEVLKTVSVDDIDLDSLKQVPDMIVERAIRLSAHYPTFIRSYKNGIAELSWQINPDGRYFMDEDGFGMTDDDEITLYGYVDRTGNPLVKLRMIESLDELRKMERQAFEYLTLRKVWNMNHSV